MLVSLLKWRTNGRRLSKHQLPLVGNDSPHSDWVESQIWSKISDIKKVYISISKNLNSSNILISQWWSSLSIFPLWQSTRNHQAVSGTSRPVLSAFDLSRYLKLLSPSALKKQKFNQPQSKCPGMSDIGIIFQYVNWQIYHTTVIHPLMNSVWQRPPWSPWYHRPWA